MSNIRKGGSSAGNVGRTESLSNHVSHKARLASGSNPSDG